MRTATLIMAGALVLWGGGCSKNEKTNTPTPGDESQPPNEPETPEVTDDKPNQAPDQYTVELSTTKGPILIEVHRDWSPHGADRFYNLVKLGYYDGVTFPVQGTLQADDWPKFNQALDDCKARLIRDLPNHTDLLTELRAKAEATQGVPAQNSVLGQNPRPTIPMPGQALRPEIRFSPGVLSEAHIL